MKRINFGLLAGIALCVIIWLALFSCLGCEYMPAFRAGAATRETLQSWLENLEAKQTELQAKYEAAEKAITEAPDPNALALAKAKKEALHEPMLINETALITLKTVLTAKSEEGGSQDRTDAIAVGVMGLVGIVVRELSRRTLNKKYVASKTGQAKLKLANPDAEAQLYALTGEARRSMGL